MKKRSNYISNFRINIKEFQKILKKNIATAFTISTISSAVAITGVNVIQNIWTNIANDNFLQSSENIDNEITSKNDQIITDLLQKYVVVNNTTASVESPYYFANSCLYKDGKCITLENEPRAYFYRCEFNQEIANNIKIKDSNLQVLYLDYSFVEADSIKYLPASLQVLSLSRCYEIKDLSNLPNICPNIRLLRIDNLPHLQNFDFIKKFPNLEEVSIKESAYIDQKLIDYLDSKGIKHNLTTQDLQNRMEIDGFVSSLDVDNLSDEEKILAITRYVMDKLEYDLNYTIPSNQIPLTEALTTGKVVCESYAYLTEVLLDKVGIKSYLIEAEKHAWNMVLLNGNYYYLDCTNIDADPFSAFMLDYFKTADYYLESAIDPDGEYADITKIFPERILKEINKISTSASPYSDKYHVLRIGEHILLDLGLLAFFLACLSRSEYKKIKEKKLIYTQQ